jgi:hypothetical protein
MSELTFSSGEREEVSEGGSPLQPHTSCGGLKKGSDEKISKTWPTPSLIISGKPINRGNKSKKTKRYTSNKTSIFFHYCRRKCHNIINYFYSKACSFCKKNGHI